MDAPVTTTPSTLELAARLRQVVIPLARQLQRETTEGLTPTQLSVIGTVIRLGPVAIGDIAAVERLSVPSVSKVIAALEADGFIERLPDHDDRRVCLVQASDEAIAWRDRTRAALNDWLVQRVDDIGEPDTEALHTAVLLLERILRG